MHICITEKILNCRKINNSIENNHKCRRKYIIDKGNIYIIYAFVQYDMLILRLKDCDEKHIKIGVSLIGG